MKYHFILPAILGFTFFSCTPSAKEAAERSCKLYTQMMAAEKSGDSVAYRRYMLQVDSIDTYYTKRFINSNPEWLLKYAELRNTCVLNSTGK